SIAPGSALARGAGVEPPSGDRAMLRHDHGSIRFGQMPGNGSTPTRSAGSGHRAEMNGQPSWTMSGSFFHDPTLVLRSRNSSLVICPSMRAWRPYWTPTLSQVRLA